jgi:hypothetical protein
LWRDGRGVCISAVCLRSARRRCDRSHVRWHGPITALRDFRSPAPNGGADQPGLIVSACRPRVCPRCDAAVLHEVAVQLALVIEPNCVCGLSAVIAAPKSVACWLKTEVREVLMRRESERPSEASNQPLTSHNVLA